MSSVYSFMMGTSQSKISLDDTSVRVKEGEGTGVGVACLVLVEHMP